MKDISEHKEIKDNNDNLMEQIHKNDKVIYNLKTEIKKIKKGKLQCERNYCKAWQRTKGVKSLGE